MGGFVLTDKQKSANDKLSWRELFFKPETRDEKIKEYVPEVLEESLASQKAVLSAEETQRDKIVAEGQKILRELENKAPIPSIFPSMVALLKLYGVKDHSVSQRALNYLLYPASATMAGGNNSNIPHELVGGFQDNFKAMIDKVEAEGTVLIGAPTPAPAQGAAAAPAAPAKPPTSEPPELTYWIKCMSGMCLANVHIGDLPNAVNCCDGALLHAIDDNRKGGVLALKAGVLNKLQRYEEAAQCAMLAIEASSRNPQGYLQGAAALRALKKDDEAIAMLEAGTVAAPASEALAKQLEVVKKTATLSLGGATEAPAAPKVAASAPKASIEA